MSASQGVLFSEPNYSETGIWCELAPGIDPAQWAHLCRHIGALTPKQFRKSRKKVCGSPDSLLNRLRGMFCFEPWDTDGVPVVCWGRMENRLNWCCKTDKKRVISFKIKDPVWS